MSTEQEILSSPGKVTMPFWPEGQQALRMIFESVDGKVIVRGRDPAKDVSVFRAELRTDQKDAFIKAVREGRAAQEIANDNEVTANGVVITGPRDDGSGPKAYQLTLAINVRAPTVASK